MLRPASFRGGSSHRYSLANGGRSRPQLGLILQLSSLNRSNRKAIPSQKSQQKAHISTSPIYRVSGSSTTTVSTSKARLIRSYSSTPSHSPPPPRSRIYLRTLLSLAFVSIAYVSFEYYKYIRAKARLLEQLAAIRQAFHTAETDEDLRETAFNSARRLLHTMYPHSPILELGPLSTPITIRNGTKIAAAETRLFELRVSPDANRYIVWLAVNIVPPSDPGSETTGSEHDDTVEMDIMYRAIKESAKRAPEGREQLEYYYTVFISIRDHIAFAPYLPGERPTVPRIRYDLLEDNGFWGGLLGGA